MTRTTLNLDPDVLHAARVLARERKQSIGETISELARKGLEPSPRIRYRNDFPVFDVREGAPAITPEMVKAALNDDATPSEE